jgi:predicted nucleic acid-binding protein
MTSDGPTYAGDMARYVIDAPTLLHVVDEGLTVHSSHQLVAPSAIRSEALQLLLDDVRRGERSDAEARERHERITELKMRLLGDRASRGLAWRLAREHDLATLRVAEYLAITRLQADALVTMDARLSATARNVVPLASVAALVSAD